MTFLISSLFTAYHYPHLYRDKVIAGHGGAKSVFSFSLTWKFIYVSHYVAIWNGFLLRST